MLGDVDLIQHGVRLIGPHLVAVDLGAGSGTTALSVLDAEPTAVVHTVDSDPVNLDWCSIAVHNAHPSANWRGHNHRSAPACSVFPAAVDLLLVDAGHSYLDVLRDWLAWSPQMNVGALAWFHDYDPPPADWGMGEDPYPGVRRAIDLLVEKGRLELVARDGMSWLGRKR
jgi:hypothetical protein